MQKLRTITKLVSNLTKIRYQLWLKYDLHKNGKEFMQKVESLIAHIGLKYFCAKNGNWIPQMDTFYAFLRLGLKGGMTEVRNKNKCAKE